MYHLLFYDYVENVVERRAPHRGAHLAFAQERLEAGELLMGGAVGEPPHGGVLLFTTAEAAETFAEADPYVKAGIVTGWRVEPWNVVIGSSSPD